MARQIPSASFVESVRFNLVHVVPNLLQGLFTRRRFWVSLCTWLDSDRRTVGLIDRLRHRYDSDYLFVHVFANRSLLVLDVEGIRQVLDQSPAVYGAPAIKCKGMSHFQPDAVTISGGEAWQERRQFNEGVLATGRRVHPQAGEFLEIVSQEVAVRQKETDGRLEWRDFEELFEKITLQVIFGRGARDDGELTEALSRLMRQSNRLIGLRKSRDFDLLYQGIRRHLEAPEPGSLISLCTQASATPATRVETQIPHWMFAMKDTLAVNVGRCLALIASHPAVEGRLRQELAQTDLASPEGIDGLRYLEGCIQEAMRLWPTTPLLSRQSLKETTLAGIRVPAETQILIVNTFNHRDSERHGFAHTFSPEVWLDRRADYHFNHLSNGPQVCAGLDLALFLGKATLARLLTDGRWALENPSLTPDRPLPYMLNHFRLRFRRVDGGAAD